MCACLPSHKSGLYVSISKAMGAKVPCSKATVDSSESISWRMPTYRMSDFEIKEIFEPMNSAIAENNRSMEEGRRKKNFCTS